MDAGRRQRITESFHALAPHGSELVERFYARLFGENPGVRPMFPEDMTQQKQHLLTSLAIIVKNIDNFGALRGPLQKLGARHAGYGAHPAHYGVVRDTLLAVMGEMAGPNWTPQLREDWTGAINAIAAVMLEGASGVGDGRIAA